MTTAAVLGAPRAVPAQPAARSARVAILIFGSQDTASHLIESFKRGLRELGYTEGKNVQFEIRFAQGRAERLAQLVTELVTLKPDVILVGALVSARAVVQATTTIPIVGIVLDPVAAGLAKSLARPGGNFTGLANMGVDTSAKQLELALSVQPKPSRIAVLVSSLNPAHPATLKNLETAAQTVGVTVVPIEAHTSVAIEEAFGRMARENTRALIVPSESFFFLQRGQIAARAIKNQIASVNAFREMVEAGGLMSYGHNNAEQFRSAAIYVDKILKGAKPGDLPIEQTSTFELVINLKTAKVLGLTIPPSLLGRADEVIQ